MGLLKRIFLAVIGRFGKGAPQGYADLTEAVRYLKPAAGEVHGNPFDKERP